MVVKIIVTFIIVITVVPRLSYDQLTYVGAFAFVILLIGPLLIAIKKGKER